MIASFESDLPSELKGSLLLKNADLDKANKNLVLATVADLKYDSVKSTLKRVFNQQNSGKASPQDLDVTEDREEEAFYTNRRRAPFKHREPQYTDVRRVSRFGYGEGESSHHRLSLIHISEPTRH